MRKDAGIQELPKLETFYSISKTDSMMETDLYLFVK